MGRSYALLSDPLVEVGRRLTGLLDTAQSQLRHTRVVVRAGGVARFERGLQT